MINLIKSAKNFKIIPNNFKSSGKFKLIEVNESDLKIELELFSPEEINDYKENSSVEVFCVNEAGLLYFETKILSLNGLNLTLQTPTDYSLIQRREYSRVKINEENIIFKDLPEDFLLDIIDISAGGVKFISNSPLDNEINYDIEIKLSNNMKIKCKMQPLRCCETDYKNKKSFAISGKFVDLENMDRVVLIQYAFKIKMEKENIQNN